MRAHEIQSDHHLYHLLKLLRMSQEAGDLEGLESAARALTEYLIILAAGLSQAA